MELTVESDAVCIYIYLKKKSSYKKQEAAHSGLNLDLHKRGEAVSFLVTQDVARSWYELHLRWVIGSW